MLAEVETGMTDKPVLVTDPTMETTPKGHPSRCLNRCVSKAGRLHREFRNQRKGLLRVHCIDLLNQGTTGPVNLWLPQVEPKTCQISNNY